MITRASPLARAPRLHAGHGSRGNLHHACGEYGPRCAEPGDRFCDDLADQPGSRVVFIEFGRSGIAAPFQFFPFHISEIADGRQ